MPIYEYQCEACSQVTEALQRFSDAPLDTCPRCGGKLSKLISRNAFHLKGGGWYVTDYKGKNSSTAACKSEGESGDSCAASSPASPAGEGATACPAAGSDD